MSTAIKVIVSPLDGGQRRVELRCGCAREGRLATVDESIAEVVGELGAKHAKIAPLCRHLGPVVPGTIR